MSMLETYSPIIQSAIITYRQVVRVLGHQAAWRAAYGIALGLGADDFHAEYIATLARFEAGANQ